MLDCLVLRSNGCGFKLAGFSSEIFRTSSSMVERTFLEAERKALVRAIEFDL
jgi:hypothetical protein